MINAFIFIWKYKILKDPTNLSYQTKEFFSLSKNTQRKVLDKYFNKLDPNFQIDNYFNTKESRFYNSNKEITFFHCYYFDKKIIEHNVENIKLADKFHLEKEKINYLIDYTLNKLKEEKINLNINEILTYPDNLPNILSKSIPFMRYLIEQDCYNIKYITYNEEVASTQRALIQIALANARKKEFNLKNFLKNDQTLPQILINNIDFILYLIENDINNIYYINEKMLENLTVTTKTLLITTILGSLKKNNANLEIIQKNSILSEILNRNEEFILYMIENNIENIQYIDWHNLLDKTRNKMIDTITEKITKENINLNIMKYPFRELFFQNYNFMCYLVQKDFRWIAITRLNSKEENDKLIEVFFKEIQTKKYRFRLEDFLEDGVYLNHYLIENKKMVHYLFEHNVPFIKHIDFFHLKSSRMFLENLLNELEKTSTEYQFKNEEYLINGKYPIPLSNNYRFMRYVIDKNFNNIAFMDISMIDKRELKRIINYAFRMVYFIRGNNKKLNFDFEGYFQNSEIVNEQYFQECLKCL